MKQQDYLEFIELMNSVCELYSKAALSEFTISIWWGAFESFSFQEVRAGLSRHIQNPDNGQFFPKPADVVRALGGTSADSAAMAWSKVDRAARMVGTYQDVAFDDAIIHAVLQDMGGWICVGGKSDSEWPFVQREFENRYRGYVTRRATPEYPPVMIGIASASNATNAHEFRPELRNYKSKPVLIGEVKRAQLVIEGGVECAGGTKITRLSDLSKDAMLLLGNGDDSGANVIDFKKQKGSLK
jgi:hypothetical protein